MAPSPIIQTRTPKIFVTLALGRATEVSTDSVLRANSTVATIRAQLLPAWFILAIHSQRPTPISPVTMMIATPATSAVCSWVAVSGLFEACSMAGFRLPIEARPTIKLTTLSAAPAYMNLTALSTDFGGGGRCGRYSLPVVGYGWVAQLAPRCLLFQAAVHWGPSASPAPPTCYENRKAAPHN